MDERKAVKKFRVLVISEATAYKTVEVLAENAWQAADRAAQMAGGDPTPWKLSDAIPNAAWADADDVEEVVERDA